MPNQYSRRVWLQAAAASAAGSCLAPALRAGPSAVVSVAKCTGYGPTLVPLIAKMFDQVGGLARLVNGKTVAIKLNLTGSPDYRLGTLAAGMAQWVHPSVVGAVVHLMGRAGARRIRLLESPWSTSEPVEEYMLQANWDVDAIRLAAPRVEFENTGNLGSGKAYARFSVPNGGLLFSAYDLNHSYRDCDVFVSLAKLKEHKTTGITLAMKNCFGITPCTIYGDHAPVDEAGTEPRGGRGLLHSGNRQPAKCSPAEKDPSSPRQGGYRVPRAVADLVAARPVHLSIIDGIHSMAGGEGPWSGDCQPVKPELLIVGTNVVSTDAVGMALMGFDPTAGRGTAPFENCDSTLRLAESLGAGTRDLNRIEIAGTPVREAVFPFRGRSAA
ncbi:MAG: DUF362 domain-containing protein [Acidobacteriales bacterium]|nr:DUF362 domain-containing protein [Terriglobales bacterium]